MGKKNEYNITKVKGIKCDYIGLFYKYYFRYSGDRELIKQYISNIQCRYTEIVPDTTFIETTPAYFEQETQRITKYEYEKAKFFYSYKEKDLKDLKFYTCIKTPEKTFHHFRFKKQLNISHDREFQRITHFKQIKRRACLKSNTRPSFHTQTLNLSSFRCSSIYRMPSTSKSPRKRVWFSVR